jgi:hypothetical protein
MSAREKEQRDIAWMAFKKAFSIDSGVGILLYHLAIGA